MARRVIPAILAAIAKHVTTCAPTIIFLAASAPHKLAMTPANKSPDKVQAAPTSRASNAFIEELLEFERLLFELSVRFANVSAENVVASIEGALMELVRFLGFDRSAFWEFIDEEQQSLSMFSGGGGCRAASARSNSRRLSLVY